MPASKLQKQINARTVELVRALRLEEGLSHVQMAKVAVITQSVIAHLESEKHGRSQSMLALVAAVLDRSRTIALSLEKDGRNKA